MNNQVAKNRNDLLSYRKILVQSFLDITKYFTKSAYDELLQKQENTKKFMQANSSSNKNKGDCHEQYSNQEEIIKNFINQKIISFNEIKFVMIFFNNDEQGISIIIKKDDPSY